MSEFILFEAEKENETSHSEDDELEYDSCKSFINDSTLSESSWTSDKVSFFIFLFTNLMHSHTNFKSYFQSMSTSTSTSEKVIADEKCRVVKRNAKC